jgi:hypothetical protein
MSNGIFHADEILAAAQKYWSGGTVLVTSGRDFVINIIIHLQSFLR